MRVYCCFNCISNIHSSSSISIMLHNFFMQNKPEPKKSISKRLKRISSSSGSELGSLSDSSPSSPEIMLARRCRNTVKYFLTFIPHCT